MFEAGDGNIKFTTKKSGSDGDLAFNSGGVSMDQKTDNGTTKVTGKYMDMEAGRLSRPCTTLTGQQSSDY